MRRSTTDPHADRRAEPRLPRLLRAPAADHVGRDPGERRLRLPADRAARHAGPEAGLRHAHLRPSAGPSSASTPTPSTRPGGRRCRTTCAPSSRSCARSPQMMSIPIRELEGYEADDVIGTLVQHGEAGGRGHLIVSGDLDGLQLVNDHVRLLTTRMGVAATVIYDEAKVMERYGLRPDQMLDYKALKGDTSDNIPGVPGVGEKTAIQLLQQFGTLDAHLRAAGRGEGQAARPAGGAPRVGLHVARGRADHHRPAGGAEPGRGPDRPLRPPRGGAALPRARVPDAHRPAAAIEHRAHRLRSRPSRRPAAACSCRSTCWVARARRNAAPMPTARPARPTDAAHAGRTP